MKTFEFLVDQLPFGYAFNFDNYLFNKVKHINTQGIKTRADYFITNNVKKRIEGKIHFLIEDDGAYSPYKSLFGGFEFNPRIHPNLIFEFWEFIENDLKNRGVRSCQITPPASCYAERKADMVNQVMEKASFSVYRKAVNHHIHVSENSLEVLMHPMEKRRLNKCKQEGFTFHQEYHEHIDEIFQYLKECRKEQNLELSISRDKLLSYLELFPQSYPIFSVRHNDKLMAATIAIQVHRQVLYSFLPGSLRKYKNYSPTVFLNDGLYQYCQQNKIDILDLGISTEADGKDQDSLIAFKERIGGEKSYKLFFAKQFN